MTVLGHLLKNRRAGEAHAAWNLPQLHAPGHLTVTSQDFEDDGVIPRPHHAKHIGGDDLSPHLAWTPPPTATAQLLLVVEDTDVPLTRPAVHCLALLDPATAHLDQGALAAREPGAGVRILRSTLGRGYHGPGPIKGHGPHHYTFQLFALASPVAAPPGGPALERARPRTLLASLTGPVLARGRVTGTVER